MRGETDITARDVARAQEEWARGIEEIGRLFTAGGDYRARAAVHIDRLYAHEHGPVLFKPTRAVAVPFRMDREAALSYFVGGNPAYPEDTGFALTPWARVRFDNQGLRLHGGYAVAMGHYYFTDLEGREVRVEYTFGYFKDQQGRLRIDLHHSSLPFADRDA